MLILPDPGSANAAVAANVRPNQRPKHMRAELTSVAQPTQAKWMQAGSTDHPTAQHRAMYWGRSKRRPAQEHEVIFNLVSGAERAVPVRVTLR